MLFFEEPASQPSHGACDGHSECESVSKESMEYFVCRQSCRTTAALVVAVVWGFGGLAWGQRDGETAGASGAQQQLPQINLGPMTNGPAWAQPFLLNGHTDVPTRLAVSADGRRLASGGADGTVRVWDLVERRELLKRDKFHTILGASHLRPRSLALSPDGQRVAYGTADNRVVAYEVNTGQVLLEEKIAPGLRLRDARGQPVARQVFGLAFAPDSQRLAVAVSILQMNDSTVDVYCLTNRQKLVSVGGLGGMARSLAWAGQGAYLAVGENQNVRLHDATDGRLLHTWAPSQNQIVYLGASPDGRILATSTTGENMRAPVEFWTVPEATPAGNPVAYPCEAGQRNRLQWSDDGRFLMLQDRGTMQLYDLATANRPQVCTYRQEDQNGRLLGIVDAVMLPDGRRLAAALGTGQVLIRSLAPDQARPLTDDEQIAAAGRALANPAPADASVEAAPSYVAAWSLAFSGERARRFLETRLAEGRQGAPGAAAWVNQLDADEFAARLQAFESLTALGIGARPALLAARDHPSLEVREKVSQLLARVDRLWSNVELALKLMPDAARAR